MLTLTADNTKLMKDLGMFVEPVEIHDDSGRFLGLFVPANLERGKRIYAEAAARTDWAELERRRQSSEKGEPLEVVLARLKLLEQELERRGAAGEKAFTTEEALAYFRSLRQQGAPPSPPVQEGGATNQCVSP